MDSKDAREEKRERWLRAERERMEKGDRRDFTLARVESQVR